MPKQVVNDVPVDEVGDCIQLHVDAGATRITAKINPDGTTFTITIVKN